jgi:hypothetical protein
MAEMAVRPLESGAGRSPVAVQALGPLAFATVGMGLPARKKTCRSPPAERAQRTTF